MILSDVRIVHSLLESLRVTEDFDRIVADRDILWRWRLCRKADDDLLQPTLDVVLRNRGQYLSQVLHGGCTYWVATSLLYDGREERMSVGVFTSTFRQEREGDVRRVYCRTMSANESVAVSGSSGVP